MVQTGKKDQPSFRNNIERFAFQFIDQKTENINEGQTHDRMVAA